MLRSVLLGTLASLFFATTFVLNRAMSLSGGSWIWSASLRFLFMIPPLLIVVQLRGGLASMFKEMRHHFWAWVVWSCVGFGLFYAPLCFSATFSPAWLVAGTWQFTIIAGSLLVPLFYEVRDTGSGPQRVRQTIPLRGLGLSLFILVGIAIMQFQQVGHIELKDLLCGTLPILAATFAYPLGNRKMMALCEGRVDAYQRVLGMTLASLPLWIVLSVVGLLTVGPPTGEQVLQSSIVAVCSGVVATVLFFAATDLAKGNARQLATVEATQSAEVVFAMLGESVFISGRLPSWWGICGTTFVIVGMVLHSLLGHSEVAEHSSVSG